MEDNPWWKTISDGRHPHMEEDLDWKTTFFGKRCLMDNNVSAVWDIITFPYLLGSSVHLHSIFCPPSFLLKRSYFGIKMLIFITWKCWLKFWYFFFTNSIWIQSILYCPPSPKKIWNIWPVSYFLDEHFYCNLNVTTRTKLC